MKLKQHAIHIIPYIFIVLILSGSLFFIPNFFVNRFTTAPALWMQGTVCIGIAISVLLAKEKILVPPIGFIFLLMGWAIYHVCQNLDNVENIITVITLSGTFFLFYILWIRLQDKAWLFVFIALLGFILSIWGLGQFTGLLPSHHNYFSITGPFDNPAGISASLAILLPFSLYACCYLKKRHRLFAIIATCFVVLTIVLSHARTAILATAILSLFFFIRLLKERGIKILPVHLVSLFIGCLLLFIGLYFMKKDSANGRLLIWQCSAQLISEKPIAGYGGNSFTANYMSEQASYFMKYPDSGHVMLAGNVHHPFNEFLKWLVNYGLIGFCLTSLLIITPIWITRKKNSPELFVFRLGLLSTGVCAFFSYPFDYPFPRLMTVVFIAFMLADGKSINPNKQNQRLTHNMAIIRPILINGYFIKMVIVLLSLGLLSVTIYQAICENKWYKVAHLSLQGQTRKMLPEYDKLHRLTYLQKKDLFLYNYGAELNYIGEYNKSNQILLECHEYMNDYDVQMLLGYNRVELGEYYLAEKHYRLAHKMIPLKFTPLYTLVKLYKETIDKSTRLIP